MSNMNALRVKTEIHTLHLLDGTYKYEGFETSFKLSLEFTAKLSQFLLFYYLSNLLNPKRTTYTQFGPKDNKLKLKLLFSFICYFIHSVRSVAEVGCAPPYDIDPRTHLNGPYVSLRKVQKFQESGRLEALEVRIIKILWLLELNYFC